MMFKSIVALALLSCLSLHVSASIKTTRDLSSFLGDSQEGESGFGDIGALIRLVRNQFKAIIEDIVIQAFKFLKVMFHQCKVNLLKRIGTYTLSDVFHTIFDGVTDFVIDVAAPEEVYEEAAKETQAYGYVHPYDTLFTAGGK